MFRRPVRDRVTCWLCEKYLGFFINGLCSRDMSMVRDQVTCMWSLFGRLACGSWMGNLLVAWKNLRFFTNNGVLDLHIMSFSLPSSKMIQRFTFFVHVLLVIFYGSHLLNLSGNFWGKFLKISSWCLYMHFTWFERYAPFLSVSLFLLIILASNLLEPVCRSLHDFHYALVIFLELTTL